MKNTTVLRAIIVLVTGLEACSDGTAPPPLQPPPNTPPPPLQPPPNNALVLSEPVASTGVSPASSVPMVPRSIWSVPVVFLSLGPGTASAGTAATVRNVTTGLQVDALLGGGGLDPIPLAASIGDSLAVTVPLSTGAPLKFGSPVPASRPPTVVRTIPANNATGVPRNQAIVVVFSEPMAPASVNATTIHLQRNGAAVAGAVAFLDSSHVTVIFTPAALLEADMPYRLVVGDGVTDLDGDHLEAPAAVEFTTGRSLLGPVADVVVKPNRDPRLARRCFNDCATFSSTEIVFLLHLSPS